MPNLAGHAHLLAQHLGGALGHVLEELQAKSLGRGPQREGHVLGVEFADDALHRPVVERDDVVEHEHEAADFVGQLRVLLGRAP